MKRILLAVGLVLAFAGVAQPAGAITCQLACSNVTTPTRASGHTVGTIPVPSMSCHLACSRATTPGGTGHNVKHITSHAATRMSVGNTPRFGPY
jgi:hypothetical protein